MKEMRVRLGELEDEAQIEQLFKTQGLDVDLPLASRDPAVLFTLIGSDDTGVRTAIIGRLGAEIHLVADPEDAETVHRIRQLAPIAEGIVMARSRELLQRGFPAVTDVQAWVPRKMERMHELMRLLKWEPERLDVVTPYYRVVGGK